MDLASLLQQLTTWQTSRGYDKDGKREEVCPDNPYGRPRRKQKVAQAARETQMEAAGDSNERYGQSLTDKNLE